MKAKLILKKLRENNGHEILLNGTGDPVFAGAVAHIRALQSSNLHDHDNPSNCYLYVFDTKYPNCCGTFKQCLEHLAYYLIYGAFENS